MLSKPFSFRKNGKLMIVNSVLENIDTFTEEELKEVLIRFKDVLYPVMTSVYIPSASMMRVIKEYAPNMKVRFKTEKSGGNSIVPITSDEFFAGELYFNTILEGLNPEWTELQKYKYLYNSLGMMLSYDLNIAQDKEFNSTHEKYARNIFTSIVKNWGICSSFAASYDYLCYRAGLESEIVSEDEHDYVVITVNGLDDYLTDPTWDATFLKFGMKTKYFGISKEQFIKSGHHLEQTEIEDYQIEELSDKEIEELDKSIGYLDLFGGIYTDEHVQTIMNNLESDSLFSKISLLLEEMKDLTVIGRPSFSDYESILNYILSNNPKFKNQVQVYDTVLENRSRAVLITVREQNIAKQYVLEENFQLKDVTHRI